MNYSKLMFFSVCLLAPLAACALETSNNNRQLQQDVLSWQRSAITCDDESAVCGINGKCVQGRCECDDHHEGLQCELPKLETCPDNQHQCYFGSKCVPSKDDSEFECDCSMFDFESIDERILSLLVEVRSDGSGCRFPDKPTSTTNSTRSDDQLGEPHKSNRNAILLIVATACFVVLECIFLRWLELRIKERRRLELDMEMDSRPLYPSPEPESSVDLELAKEEI